MSGAQVNDGDWMKVYSELVGQWQLMMKMDLHHDDTERPPIYYLSAVLAQTEIEISASH